MAALKRRPYPSKASRRKTNKVRKLFSRKPIWKNRWFFQNWLVVGPQTKTYNKYVLYVRGLGVGSVVGPQTKRTKTKFLYVGGLGVGVVVGPQRLAKQTILEDLILFL